MQIVENGQTKTTILVGANPSVVEQFAAEELSEYIGKIAGVSLPVAVGPQPGPNIVVGREPAVAALGAEPSFPGDTPDAFVIRSAGPDLILLGQGDRGTLYAVYTLLERYLGVRFWGPGRENEDVPQADRIELPEIDDVEAPDQVYRCRGSVGSLEEIARPESLLMFDWMAKNRINTFLLPIVHYDGMKRSYGDEIAKRGIDMEVGHHDFDFWVPQSELFDTHPEYFSLVKGERLRATRFWQDRLAFGTQLCLANPEVVHITAERMKAYLRENPEVVILDLWPNDNFGACECEECKALNDPGHAAVWPTMPKRSRSYQAFVNKVAEQVTEEFPHARISMISYVDGLEPGEDVPMHPNVEVNVALYRECYSHSIDDPACERNRFYLETLEKWLKLARRVVLFEYYYKCAWNSLPFGIVRKIVADQRVFRELGVYGNGPQITAFNFGSLGLNYYAYARSAWDADVDAGQIMSEYCRGYYGPGGESALRYYETLEEAMAAAGANCPIVAFEPSFDEVFSAELLRRLREAVGDAEAAVCDAEPCFQRRVGELSIAMDYTERYLGARDLVEQAKSAGESGDTERARELLDQAEQQGLAAFAFGLSHQQQGRVIVTRTDCREFGDYLERCWRLAIDRHRQVLD